MFRASAAALAGIGLLAGSVRAAPEGLREQLLAAQDQYRARHYAQARTGFLRALAGSGARLSGDARARVGLAAARASFALGDAAGAARMVTFARQQTGATAATLARLTRAEARLAQVAPSAPVAQAAQVAPLPQGASIAQVAQVAPIAQVAQVPQVAPEPARPPPQRVTTPPADDPSAPALPVTTDGRAQFVRMTPDESAPHGEFQTATAIYRRPAGGPEIMLCGMVHVGIKSYYEAVTADLRPLNAVLLEGLRDHSATAERLRGPLGYGREWRSDDGVGSPTDDHGHQLMHQFRGVDWDALAGVECDVSFGDLEDLEQKRYGTRTAVKYIVNGGLLDQLPCAFAPGLDLRDCARLLAIGAPTPGALAAFTRSVQDLVDAPSVAVHDWLILTARNDHVWEALTTYFPRPRSYRVAVMYGAAHMPDLDQRLRAAGYRVTEVRWNTVWSF